MDGDACASAFDEKPETIFKIHGDAHWQKYISNWNEVSKSLQFWTRYAVYLIAPTFLEEATRGRNYGTLPVSRRRRSTRQVAPAPYKNGAARALVSEGRARVRHRGKRSSL